MTDAELLAAYRATTWTVAAAGARLTLRLDAPAPLPADLLPGGIVTAYNPASRLRPLDENRAAHRRLRAALRATGARLAPTLARGAGPDARRWEERGLLAAGIGRETVVGLAASFDQNAIVWIDAAGRAALFATRRGFCDAEIGDPLPSRTR